MKASIAIQILPGTLDDQEVIRVVDEVIDYIAGTGLNYYVGPFETTVEGDDFDELMAIVSESVKVAHKAGSDKVSAYVKITSAAEGGVLTIDEKVTKHHQ